MARARQSQEVTPPTPSAEQLRWFKDLVDCLKGKKTLQEAGPKMSTRSWCGDPSDLSHRLGELEDHYRPPNSPKWAFVDRSPGRASRVRVTEAGEELYQRICAFLPHYERVTASDLSPRELVTFGATNYMLTYAGKSVVFVMGGGLAIRFNAERGRFRVGEPYGVLHSTNFAVTGMT